MDEVFYFCRVVYYRAWNWVWPQIWVSNTTPRSATGFATKRGGVCNPVAYVCVCNHACLTTKRYGRDYKSRPAAERAYSGLRCNCAASAKRDGVCNPVAYVCVCNQACLTTKSYGRDYKSRPAAERAYFGLRCNCAASGYIRATMLIFHCTMRNISE